MTGEPFLFTQKIQLLHKMNMVIFSQNFSANLFALRLH